jgi:hypothetical protein
MTILPEGQKRSNDFFGFNSSKIDPFLFFLLSSADSGADFADNLRKSAVNSAILCEKQYRCYSECKLLSFSLYVLISFESGYIEIINKLIS